MPIAYRVHMAAHADKPKPEVNVNQKWCKGCGICIAFCPKKVFETGAQGHPVVASEEACIRCMLCVERCPDFAIKVK